MLFIDLIAQGLVQGSIYALVALGLTLVYGLLRILHVAHAALFTLGGYMGVLVTNQFDSLGLAMVVAILVSGFAGVLMYRLCYEPILHRPPFVALIASIGLFIASEEIFRIAFGAYGLSYKNPPLQAQVSIGFLSFKQAELLVMIGGALIIGVLALLQSKTRLGIACQATVTDPQMAESFGIDLKKVRYVNFFIGSGLAGMAGVMVALLNNLVEPTMGSVPSYKALAIIVLGGLGSVPGTLMAALTLGVVESFGTIYLGKLLDRNAIAFAFLILVLMVRPQGLFARK
jgi:branched-chain amino acid transport system permease protein